jgi:hypothetical protein
VRENNGSAKNHVAERSDHETRPALPLPQNAAVKNSTPPLPFCVDENDALAKTA